MGQPELPLVLIPRHTAYVGQGAYTTVGLDVMLFESATVTVWRGAFVGMGTSFRITFQESDDQTNWVTCGNTTASIDVPEDTELVEEPTFSRRYFRFLANLQGINAGVTCRATGFLRKRRP